MNASFEFQQAISQKDFDRFKQLIGNGMDVSQRLDSNNTLLHFLASVEWELSTSQSVKSLFRYTVTIIDWLQEIQLSMPKNKPLKEFFTLQNDMGQTCMHVAITNENWIFATAILHSFRINYRVDGDDMYRRDQLGLTESERFLILYGIKGREKQFHALFENKKCSILELKSASKAFKVINLNYEKFAVFPSSHRFYKSAIERDYPSPYAEIEDPFLLEQVYEENGIVDPTKESRDTEHWYIQYELDHLTYDGSLNEDPEHIMSFLKSYADVLWYQNHKKSYIITCVSEFCKETPSIYMANLSEEIVSDLHKASKLDSFSQYAQLISKLIIKFSNLTSLNK